MDRPETPTGSLVLLAILSSAVGLGLVASAQAVAPTAGTFGAAFLSVAVLVAVVQALPIRIDVARESTSLVISELPLGIGLFVLSPVELVASRLLGLLVFLLVRRRGYLIKHAVTSAAYLFEVGVAAAMFWFWLGPAGAAEQRSAALVVALVAVVTATSVGAVITSIAMGLATRRLRLDDVWEAQRVMLPASLANASVALVAVVVIHREPTASWLLAIPLAVLLMGYRRYLAERRDRRFLAAMYALARDVHRARDVPEAFEVFARTLREHIGASRVELYLQRTGGNRWGMAAEGDGTITELYRVEQLPPPVVASLASAEPVLEHDHRGRCTSVSYALDLGDDRHLAFVARDPASDVAGFQASAASVLTAVASHARAVLEDVELQEAKNSFLSNVSHELRTPLSVVLGAAETLHEQRARLPVDVRDLLVTRMHAQAIRLDGLLSNLLDVDRLGRGLLEPHWSSTDLGALIRACVATLGIETHHVEVDVEPLPTAVDAVACERIVENLVLNAAKYTAPGSTITVRVQAENEAALITVEDQGEGIADGDKRRVFQPFVRLDPDHHSPGTGIGLSLVERLVGMQGGQVRVEDAPGGGARFAVRIPLRGAAVPVASGARDGPHRNGVAVLARPSVTG